MSDLQALVGPTYHRLAHAKGAEIEVPVVNQRVVRKAWRVVPVVETMHKQGKISDEQFSAWERFERAWHSAGLMPRITAKYGEQAISGGTLVKQLTYDAMRSIEIADDKRRDDTSFVFGVLNQMHVPRHRALLVMLVTEECRLEDIGRRFGRYTDRGKAIAVAASLIEDTLWLLHLYHRGLCQPAQKVY